MTALPYSPMEDALESLAHLGALTGDRGPSSRSASSHTYPPRIPPAAITTKGAA